MVDQGTIKEPAKPQSHSDNIALIETTYEGINEKECQPYKISLASNEESSTPTEAAGVHVYAAVAKKSKKKPKAAEATTEESPKKELETAQTAETWPCAPLTRPLPYESETYTYIYIYIYIYIYSEMLLINLLHQSKLAYLHSELLPVVNATVNSIPIVFVIENIL